MKRALLSALTVCLVASVGLFPIVVLLATATGGQVQFRPLFNSTLVAGSSATTALAAGVVVSIAARFSAPQVRRIIEVVLLLQITLPHSVIGAVLNAMLGRTSMWAGSCPGCDFSGQVPLWLTLSISLFPLAYFGTWLGVRTISNQEIDSARIIGLETADFLRTVFLGRISMTSPGLFAIMFVIAISDPVTPNLIAPSLPTVATQMWFRANAYGNQQQEAIQALMVCIPVFGVVGVTGMVYAKLFRRFPQILRLFRSNHETDNDPHLGTPVGSHAIQPHLVLLAFGSVSFFVIYSLLRTRARSELAQASTIEVVINTMGLSFIVLICALALSSLALHVRTIEGRRWGWRGRRVMDVLVAALLFVPSATIGSGLRIALSRCLEWWGLNSSVPGLGFMVLACLPASLSLTYFMMVMVGPLISRDEYQMALLQGVRPAFAITSVVLPRSTNLLMWGFLIIFSNSAVLATPLLWVSTPDTPVVLLRLFMVLDAANYPEASAISMVVSVIIAVMASAVTVGLRGATVPRLRKDRSTGV